MIAVTIGMVLIHRGPNRHHVIRSRHHAQHGESTDTLVIRTMRPIVINIESGVVVWTLRIALVAQWRQIANVFHRHRNEVPFIPSRIAKLIDGIHIHDFHILVPISHATLIWIIISAAWISFTAVKLIQHMELMVAIPLARDPAGIEELVLVGEGIRVLVEHLAFPSLSIVVTVDHHAIAPCIVHNKCQAVVVGGLHPMATVGVPVNGVLRAHERKNYIFFIPSPASIRGAEIDQRIGDVFHTFKIIVSCRHKDVDDVAVRTRSHHSGPLKIIRVVEHAYRLQRIRFDLVFVFYDIDAAITWGMGGNDKTIGTILGDRSEACFLVFHTATDCSPFSGRGMIHSDSRTTVRVVLVLRNRIGEVDIPVGPNMGPGTGTVVRLPVV